MAPGDQMLTRNWFVPGEGIDRNVITGEIQRYLGNDATVRPGLGTDDYEDVPGYWIKAFRNLTSFQIEDLRTTSARWRQEQRGHQSSGGEYTESRTYHGRPHNARAPRAGDSPLGPDAYMGPPRAGPGARLQSSNMDDPMIVDQQYPPMLQNRYDQDRRYLNDGRQYQDRPFNDGRPQQYNEPGGYRPGPPPMQPTYGEPRIPDSRGPAQQFGGSSMSNGLSGYRAPDNFYSGSSAGPYTGAPPPQMPQYSNGPGLNQGYNNNNSNGLPPRDRYPPNGPINDYRDNNQRYAYPSPPTTVIDPRDNASGPNLPSGGYPPMSTQGPGQPSYGYDSRQQSQQTTLPTIPGTTFPPFPPTIGGTRPSTQGQQRPTNSDRPSDAQRRRLN